MFGLYCIDLLGGPFSRRPSFIIGLLLVLLGSRPLGLFLPVLPRCLIAALWSITRLRVPRVRTVTLLLLLQLCLSGLLISSLLSLFVFVSGSIQVFRRCMNGSLHLASNAPGG